MRWFITGLLIVVVATGVAALLQVDRIRTAVGLQPNQPSAAESETARSLAFTVDSIKQINLRVYDQEERAEKNLTILRDASGAWTQPGNWALREIEVNELVNTLTSLSSRFLPIRLEGDAAKLSLYGLEPDQHPVVVSVSLGASTVTLRFGSAPAPPGTPTFASPAYLRVDGNPEVIRISSDVLRVLSRSPEDYRRRQLFPDAPRVRLSGDTSGPLTPILGDTVERLTVRTPAGTYTLKRTAPLPPQRRQADRSGAEPSIRLNELAAAWEMIEPVRDRVEPTKLRTILSAIPDLWADTFTTRPVDAANLAATGLDRPEREITITPASGKPISVKIGNVSRTVTREGPPAPSMPPLPPMPTKITEEFYYARFDDNALIFEMRADKLMELSVAPAELRDPLLARFTTPEVTTLTIAAKGQPPIVVTRKKGKKIAEKDDERQDRWYVGGLPAETAKVTELLDALAKLETRAVPQPPALSPMAPPPSLDKAIIDNPDAKTLTDLGLEPASAGITVTVVSQVEVPEGDPVPPAQTSTLIFGKPEAEKKKLPVLVAGWPRANLVDDAALKLLSRPALAYRGRRPIDTAELELQRLDITADGGKSFELVTRPSDAKSPGKNWSLVKPANADADPARVGKLTDDLTRLEVVDYIDDSPKPEDLASKYALAKPRFTVELGFDGAKPKTNIIEIGGEVAGKPEVYARLDRTGSIFTLPRSVVDSLARGPEDMVALQQWSIDPTKIQEVAITRATDAPYTLKLVDGKWTVSGPYTAPADVNAVQPLLGALSNLRAEKYETLASTDPAKFGLDKPALRVKLVHKEPRTDAAGAPAGAEQDRTRELIVGGPTAAGSATRFAQLIGEKNLPGAVFVLQGEVVKPLEVTAIDLLDRQLLTLDARAVSKIVIASSTPESALALVRGEKDAWKPEGATFPLDKQTVDRFVFATTHLPVIRLAAYGPAVKWADYGLDKPTNTITLTATGEKPETKTILLGKEEPTGERYIRVADGPAVGVVSGNGAAALAVGKLDFVERTLLNFDPNTLSSLIRKKGAEELELSQAGTGWEIARPTKTKADAPLIDDLADQLSHLRAERVAAFAPRDLKPFGLDAPAATITLKFGAKPETLTLKIGGPVDAAKPASDRFIAVDPAPNVIVGTITGPLARRLLAEPIQFQDRTLGGFRGDPDKIVIERGERKTTFTKDGGTWKMIEPTAADAEQADLEELVNAMAKLRGDELVAIKPTDVKPFGLDPPAARIRFLVGANEVLVLQVGAKEKDGPRVYSRLEKGDIVALLDPALSGKVLAEYRKRAVWSGVDASQATTLAVNSGESTFVLRKASGFWIDAEKPADRFDTAAVSDTLAVLAGLRAERYAVDKNADLKLYGLEKPRRVIVIGQQGGTSKTLRIGGEVGGTNGKQVYASVDDKGRNDVFILSESDTAKLLRDRPAYISKK